MNVRNPFIPIKKADAVIIDGRVEQEITKKLNKMDIQTIRTVKCEEVDEAIAYHPDIAIHPIDANTLVIAPNVFEYYKYIFKNRPIKLIKGDKYLKGNYPNDIAYNVARVSRYAIHNTKYTSPKLKYYLEKQGIRLIHVNQGYTKCSTAIVGSNSIITSDPSIYKACKKYNIDLLYIKSGYIKLPGYDYGFIGGATGVISEKEFLFTGRYDNHPNKKDIDKFLAKNNKKAVILSDKEIIDIGSIIPLKYN
ncbi:DUF6873 family GME fold protein [Caldisalinibacter kiritimatiensis]|uniref:DUF6873 domain-containing protein n=1 Tax=Caldisalinibacter kiritimatiensis TaxID=1304284 RepID=R1CWA1_9FIRM|nr:hypothetical protein [Caldisalinibacter kiritimatiensis]EOD00909.1 hypothetical protein L21TH_1017 [Caldisalinibacter kiritimatiensis]